MKICLRTSLTWIQIICQTSFPKKKEYSIQRLVLVSALLEVFFGFVIFFGWWRYNQVKHRILILTHHRSGSTFTGELFNLHSQKGFQIDAFSSTFARVPLCSAYSILISLKTYLRLFTCLNHYVTLQERLTYIKYPLYSKQKLKVLRSNV